MSDASILKSHSCAPENSLFSKASGGGTLDADYRRMACLSQEKGGSPELRKQSGRGIGFVSVPLGPTSRAHQSQDLPTLSQRSDVLVGLGREMKAYIRCYRSYSRNELRSEDLYKAVVGADCESPFNSARSKEAAAGRSAARALCARSRMRSRSSVACGVGTMPRPARTSSGSPVAARSRASVRLVAEALRFKRRAAPTTVPSASKASNAINRFRSISAIVGRQRTGHCCWAVRQHRDKLSPSPLTRRGNSVASSRQKLLDLRCCPAYRRGAVLTSDRPQGSPLGSY